MSYARCMRPYVAFAACLGAALGLVAYRFGVMPIGWNGDAKTVLEYGAPMLGIGGWLAVRGRTGRWPLAAMVPALAAGGALAFAAAYVFVPSPARAVLTTRELPGFAIDLPSGDRRAEVLDYATGRLQLVDVAGAGGVLDVQWEPGEAIGPDDLALFGSAFGGLVGGRGAHPMTMRGRDGKPIDAFALDSAKGTILVAVLPCGARRFAIMVGGEGAESLERRIVASVVCHPDPARERELDASPLAIDLPAGWKRVPGDPSLVQLTDGSSGLLLKTITATNDERDLPTVLTGIMRAMGQPLAIGDERGDSFPLSGTLDGQPVVGWVRVVPCGQKSVVVFEMSSDQTAAEQVATLVRDKSHCVP